MYQHTYYFRLGFITFLLLITSILTIDAQPKFGKIDDELVKMTSYEKDPNAHAVLLENYERVEYQFLNQPVLLRHVHRRIKILSEAGVDFADVEIPYVGMDRYESVSAVKGMTYWADEGGNVLKYKLEKANIFDEKLNEQEYEKRFSLPQVKPGCVIEYAYTLTSKQVWYLPTLYMQQNIPVEYSKIVTNIPEAFKFRVLTLGNVIPVETTKRSKNLILGAGETLESIETTYEANDIPALEEEPFVSSLKNYYFRLEFEITGLEIPGVLYENYQKTWGQLATNLKESNHFGKLLRESKSVKAYTEQLLVQKPDSVATFPYLFHQIQQDIRWNKYFGKYPSADAKELIEAKEGNGAAINFLLINVLNTAGIKAYPVLISTKQNGFPRKVFPTLNQFNHTILCVDTGDDSILVDATSDFNRADLLPEWDLNMAGLLIRDNSYEWRNLTPRFSGKRTNAMVLKMDEDGQLSGTSEVTDKGYRAYNDRMLFNNSEDKESYARSALFSSANKGDIETVEIKHASSLYEPFVMKGTVATSDFVNIAGDLVYVQPLMGKGFSENPFKLNTRMYPVDYTYPRENQIRITLVLPQGYTVEELPQPAKYVLPNNGASFLYQAQVVGNMVQVMSKLNIEQTMFMESEYSDLKSFYDYVVQKQAEQVVIRKELETKGE